MRGGSCLRWRRRSWPTRVQVCEPCCSRTLRDPFADSLSDLYMSSPCSSSFSFYFSLYLSFSSSFTVPFPFPLPLPFPFPFPLFLFFPLSPVQICGFLFVLGSDSLRGNLKGLMIGNGEVDAAAAFRSYSPWLFATVRLSTRCKRERERQRETDRERERERAREREGERQREKDRQREG